MAFNIRDIMNAATTGAAVETIEKDFEEIRLDYEKIVVTEHNKYSMDEIGELAAGIEMTGGLHEPLILGRVNGEYWLASGHRRRAAIEMLVQGGADNFRVVNCRCKDMTETEFRLHVLIGNAFNRHYTDYDKMMEAEEWKNALKAAQREKLLILEKGERVRDYVARVMGTSAAVVGDYNRINKNATQEIKEQFKDGTIGVTAAAAASQLPEDEQKEIAERAAAGEDIKAQEIRNMVDAKKAEAAAGGENEEKTEQSKEKRSITEQKTEQMSDTDTNEEEKENARRLHALKMLEKYYIYMSDEEVGILERILEDCKRRKREYNLDDVGSTI
ncbi:MAG: ParB N-terminal domain-containing protein [Lachnospiraceae bacterium]|nr:ParB N-terminal domain-containing protein [Lachnospiraceae bacterium]MBD5505989.1 ParB N-terminal domain-containing protein [Lachnospiraceae bacterium]